MNPQTEISNSGAILTVKCYIPHIKYDAPVRNLGEGVEKRVRNVDKS